MGVNASPRFYYAAPPSLHANQFNHLAFKRRVEEIVSLDGNTSSNSADSAHIFKPSGPNKQCNIQELVIFA